MHVETSDQRERSLPEKLSWIVLLLCGLDLVGWWLHIPLLTSVLPHYATMKPNTALCLALVSLAVLGSGVRDGEKGRWSLLGPVAGGAAVLLSGASLLEYIVERSFGIDQILYAVPMERFADPAGRMSFGTALCLLLTSTAVVGLDALPRLSTGLLLVASTISTTGIVGFIFREGPLADVLWLRSLAIHTASALLLLDLALLMLRPKREPFRTLTQQKRREGRRSYLLLAVLLLPVVLGLPVLAGMEAKFYEARFALAFLVVLLMGIQTLILWADNKALEQVEDTLRERELESSRILHSIGDAVIVTDVNSRVLRMNPIAEDLTGWRLAEARGKDLVEIFPIFSEATGEVVENPVDKVRRLGTIVGIANHTILRHRSGRNIHIDDSSAPIRDEHGSLTGIVLVFRNVDERKAAEANLQSSENKLMVALEAARLGNWELDLQTMELSCSPLCKANLGRGPDDPFTYDDLLESIHPEDRLAAEASIRQAIQEQRTYRSEYRVTWPDYSQHWIIASGQVIMSELADPIRMVGVIMDVTERHQAAEALIQSEKLAAVGRLAASIAHEINNPLESVTNLLYLVRTNAETPEVRDFMATAERELQRASAVTNQTLRFHKQSTKPQEVASKELLEGVLSIYQGKLMNANVTVLRGRFTDQPILCFEGEIRQVISNLIGNAVDAMNPTGGKLLIRSRVSTNWASEESGITITIADTGSGMSSVTAKRLFEPFYTTKGTAGTGLGLWISQEIVLRHRGRLKVRSSQRVGRTGTVFTVFLPFRAATR